MFKGRSTIGVVGAAIAAAIGFSTAARRNDAGEISSAGSVDAFEVRVGDCFDDGAFASSEISEVPGIPCAEPHDNEIYAAFDLTATEWPGEDQIEQMASEGCYDRFTAAIGKSYEDSAIDFTTIYPSKNSWERIDDREVLCVGYDMNQEKLTGSIIGSAL